MRGSASATAGSTAGETAPLRRPVLQVGGVDRTRTAPFLLRIFTASSATDPRPVEDYRALLPVSDKDTWTLANLVAPEGEPVDEAKAATRASIVESQMQLYTWLDASLGELTDLVCGNLTDLVPSGKERVTFSFSLVYPNRADSGNMVRKAIGETQRNTAGEAAVVVPSETEAKTLDAVRFLPGDWLELTVGVGSQQAAAEQQGEQQSSARPADEDAEMS
jgi:Sin3 associated polypeptide p18 (SAP18)